MNLSMSGPGLRMCSPSKCIKAGATQMLVLVNPLNKSKTDRYNKMVIFNNISLLSLPVEDVIFANILPRLEPKDW